VTGRMDHLIETMNGLLGAVISLIVPRGEFRLYRKSGGSKIRPCVASDNFLSDVLINQKCPTPELNLKPTVIDY
jgi:hypothetical protein